MSNLLIQLHWQRVEPALLTGKYSNAHTVRFNDACAVQVDAAPDWGGDPAHTNPEQALASALSSCHMMTFLALAAKAGAAQVMVENMCVRDALEGIGAFIAKSAPEWQGT